MPNLQSPHALSAKVLPAAALLAFTPSLNSAPETQVLFGAVRGHASYPFYAFTNCSLSTPADAYKWGQGTAIGKYFGAGWASNAAPGQP